MPSPRSVIAVVPDLFFSTRIAETARAAGVVYQACTARDALSACRDRAPDLLIVDLAAASGDPIGLARALKSDPATERIPIVGFYPHVENELRMRALAAGVDHVLPRSAFTVRLASMLARESGEKDVPAADPGC